MPPKAAEVAEPPSRWEKFRLFIIKNFLPLAFLIALTWALAWPVPGRYLAEITVLGNVKIMQVVPMAVVFLITGLQLDTAAMKRALALRNAPSIVYGFLAILLITPCLGFLFLEIPLRPYEFSIGLTVFCVAPTTLGVGVALTVACGGNDAVALLLTVGTNALAVVTMPPELRLLLHGVQDPNPVTASPPLPPAPSPLGAYSNGTGGSAWPPPPPSPPPGSAEDQSFNMAVSITDLLIKLAITVLVPFIIGKCLREAFPAVLHFVKSNRVPLSLFSTSCLAFVVWQTLSSARDLLLEQSAGPVLAMMGLSVGMHLVYLLFNYLVVWFLLRPPLKEAVAVVIMASQKSAPVAVTVIAYLVKSTQQQGLLALPAVVGQLAQIFIGSGLAAWLSGVVKRNDALEKAKAALAAAEAEAAAAEALEAGTALPPPGDGGSSPGAPPVAGGPPAAAPADGVPVEGLPVAAARAAVGIAAGVATAVPPKAALESETRAAAAAAAAEPKAAGKWSGCWPRGGAATSAPAEAVAASAAAAAAAPALAALTAPAAAALTQPAACGEVQLPTHARGAGAGRSGSGGGSGSGGASRSGSARAGSALAVTADADAGVGGGANGSGTVTGSDMEFAALAAISAVPSVKVK
ncbi:hypothetical protein CHLRE_02g147450v5 [Chlamydomonas reinhardtii]|uniref:Uncharacterized protein n=1 Tax=Chlamydomonas reinhardtii TaxID=3055 RepID=A0A2K3E3P7_CHLRE|nr:uncharacterized protein CHLRE_02g147450v5 [Chlamydomonas reinhardtii]PNW87393.1 hypothetical protein CHLRE_02g147450v5 [Chlamydomonas reinhardtii]